MYNAPTYSKPPAPTDPNVNQVQGAPVPGGLIMPTGKPAPTQQGMPAPAPAYNNMMGAPPPPQYSQQPGSQPPGTPTGVPQTYNLNQFQQWATQTFGRNANQAELDRIGRRVGAGDKSGQYTQQQYNDAMDEAYKIAKEQGWQGQIPGQQAGPNWQNPDTIMPVTGRMFGPQYQNPYNAQQQQLMNDILGSGGSMNQQVQDQMFEKQKEMMNMFAKQQGAQMAQNVAGRGFGTGGNAAAVTQQQTNHALMRELMGGRRDIEAQAAQVNRADQLAALQASMGLDQQGYQQFMGDRNSSLQEWLAQRNNDLENRRLGQQDNQFKRSLELEFQRFIESQRQFNQNFGENQRQYNNQMGFNYANMNNNNNNSFMRYLMGY